MISLSVGSVDLVPTVDCVANGHSGPLQEHAHIAFGDVEQDADLCRIKLLMAPTDQDRTLRRRQGLHQLCDICCLPPLGLTGGAYHVPGGIYD